MIEDKEALISSLILSSEGILPNLHQGRIIDDYPVLIAKIKKISKPCASVRCIDKIACQILCEMFRVEHDLENHGPLKKEDVRELLHNNSSIKNFIEDDLSLIMSREDNLAILDFILDHMPIFASPVGHGLRPKIDVYNYIISNRNKVQKDLNLVLGRQVTSEDINFISSLFLRYMAFAQDLESKDNGTREKIRELRKSISKISGFIADQILEAEEFIQTLESMERHPDCDLENEKINLLQLKESKVRYEKLEVNFNLRDGNPYCLDSIKKYGYFSMIFCALSLGLKAPNKARNYEGNPIIAFLFAVQGLANFVVDHDSATDRVSRSYAQFNYEMECNVKFKIYVTQLLDSISKKPDCQSTWRAANRAFQSILPKIVINPKFKLS